MYEPIVVIDNEVLTARLFTAKPDEGQHNGLAINKYASELIGLFNNLPEYTSSLLIYTASEFTLEECLLLGQILAQVKLPENLRDLSLILSADMLPVFGHQSYKNLLQQSIAQLTAAIIKILSKQNPKIVLTLYISSDNSVKLLEKILGLVDGIKLRLNINSTAMLSHQGLLELIDLMKKSQVESNLWDKIVDKLPMWKSAEIVDILYKLPTQLESSSVDGNLQVQIISEQKYLEVMHLLQDNPVAHSQFATNFYIANTRIFSEQGFLKFILALPEPYSHTIDFNGNFLSYNISNNIHEQFMQEIMHNFKNKAITSNLWQKLHEILGFDSYLGCYQGLAQIIKILQMLPKFQISQIRESILFDWIRALQLPEIIRLIEIVEDNSDNFYEIFFSEISMRYDRQREHPTLENVIEIIDKLPTAKLKEQFVGKLFGAWALVMAMIDNSDAPENIAAGVAMIMDKIQQHHINKLEVTISHSSSAAQLGLSAIQLKSVFGGVADKITLVVNQTILIRLMYFVRTEQTNREIFGTLHKNAKLVIKESKFFLPNYACKVEDFIDNLVEFSNIEYLKIDIPQQRTPLFKFKTAREILDKFKRFREVEFDVVKLSDLRQRANATPDFLNKTFATVSQASKEVYIDSLGQVKHAGTAAINDLLINFKTINVYKEQQRSVEKLMLDYKTIHITHINTRFVRFSKRDDLGLSFFGSQNKKVHPLPTEVKIKILAFMPVKEISRLKELCKLKDEQEVPVSHGNITPVI